MTVWLSQYVWHDRSGKKAIKKVFKFVLKVVKVLVIGVALSYITGGLLIGNPAIQGGNIFQAGASTGTWMSASATTVGYTLWSPAALLVPTGGGGGGGNSVLEPIPPAEPPPNPKAMEIDPMKVKIKAVLTNPELQELNSPTHSDGFSNVDPYKEKGFDIAKHQEDIYKAQGGIMPEDQKKAPNGEYINKWKDGTWTYMNGNPYATTEEPGSVFGATSGYLDQDGVWRYNNGGVMPTTRTVNDQVLTVGVDGRWRYADGTIYERSGTDN